jgi:hypothetical protein
VALTFASGQFVNCGSAAALDDLALGSFTLWAWVYRTSNGGNQHIITKDGSHPSGWVLAADNGAGEGEVRFIVFRTTTGSNWTDAISATGQIPLNTWTFVAATASNASGTITPRIYIGNLGTAAVEPSYQLQQTGTAGTPSPDAAYNCYVGNLARATTLPFLGRIARTGVVNRALSREELIRVQYGSIPAANVSGTVLLLDLHGTGAPIDYSGAQNAPTLTGPPTSADHAPLVHPWSPPLWRVVWSAAGGTPGTLTVTAADAPAAGGTVTLDAASALTVTAATAPAAGGTVALSAASALTVTTTDAAASGDGALTASASLTVTAATAAATADGDLTGATTVAYAVGTVSAGAWTAVGAATIHEAIDEPTTPSDAEYAQSDLSPVSASAVRIAFGALTDPTVDTGHTVRYRLGKSSAGGDALAVTARLYQGATLIATDPTVRTVPDSFTTYSWTLDAADADDISDYADLRLDLSAVKV